MTNFLPLRLWASLLALGVFVAHALAAVVLPVLQTKTDTYANVTVISKTPTHIFIQHSRGVANIKLSALDAQALTALGYRSTDEAVVQANANNPAIAAAAASNSPSRFAGLTDSLHNLKGRFAPGVHTPQFGQTMGLVILGGVILAYFFFCYCASLIVNKTGNEPGWLIWVPVLQTFPMLRAASMSGWWFLALFVPVLSLVVQIIWCFKISQARGKGVVTAIMLVLPLTNLFAFLYLAFADGKGVDGAGKDTLGKPMETEPLPV